MDGACPKVGESTSEMPLELFMRIELERSPLVVLANMSIFPVARGLT